MNKSDEMNKIFSSDEEVNFLQTELMNYSSQVDGIVKHGATATGALLAAALGVGEAPGVLVALSPLVILTPLHSLVMNRKMNMVRIATYIRRYAGIDWQYEKRIHEFRKEMNKGEGSENSLGFIWESYEFATNGMFIILGYVSLACSFLLLGKTLTVPINFAWLISIFPILGILWWIFYHFSKREKMNRAKMGIMKDEKDGKGLEEMCFDIWVKVADGEQIASKDT